MGLLNWLRGLRCAKHEPVLRYNGMNVFGYVCLKCGHEGYEKRKSHSVMAEALKNEMQVSQQHQTEIERLLASIKADECPNPKCKYGRDARCANPLHEKE
jgi:hypothetical protein